jgi:hypothetical protein
MHLELIFWDETWYTSQWEHFIQKGGQKFYLVRILLFMVRILLFFHLKDSWPFFDKIRSGQFVGKNSGYSANIMTRLKKN